jgi:DDE superfamily endonuclease
MPKQKHPAIQAQPSVEASASVPDVPPKPINLPMLDLYSDYLTCSFGLTTATGMSAVLDGAVGHDDVTRFLSEREYTNKDLWKLVKPTIRQIETNDGVLVLDDTIEEKPYTDENDIIAWHYDHVFNRQVKGVNILNALYHNGQGDVPLGFAIVKKDVHFTDPVTGKPKRRSAVTKNELARELIGTTIRNQVKFRYVLADSWFSSQENMEFVVARKKHFIFALKSNRTFAESMEQKLKGAFRPIESLTWEENTTKTGYLKGMAMPVQITRQVFTNEDGSRGVLYLATSDLTLGYTDITTIYQERWKVEEYHKSTKSNLGLAKSPTKKVVTQSNHFFAVAYAYHKLERLARGTHMNHFALKAKLYVKALQASMAELHRLKRTGGFA